MPLILCTFGSLPPILLYLQVQRTQQDTLVTILIHWFDIFMEMVDILVMEVSMVLLNLKVQSFISLQQILLT